MSGGARTSRQHNDGHYRWHAAGRTELDAGAAFGDDLLLARHNDRRHGRADGVDHRVAEVLEQRDVRDVGAVQEERQVGAHRRRHLRKELLDVKARSVVPQLVAVLSEARLEGLWHVLVVHPLLEGAQLPLRLLIAGAQRQRDRRHQPSDHPKDEVAHQLRAEHEHSAAAVRGEGLSNAERRCPALDLQQGEAHLSVGVAVLQRIQHEVHRLEVAAARPRHGLLTRSNHVRPPGLSVRTIVAGTFGNRSLDCRESNAAYAA